MKSILRQLLLIIVVATGCNFPTPVKPESKSGDPIRASDVEDMDTLPKKIVVFIARGGCCYGHIISIDKDGDLKYFVGSYSKPQSSDSTSAEILLERFDPNQIEVDKKYIPKYREVAGEKLEQLARLVRREEELSFRDNAVVKDAYLYNIYLDQKRIAYGYNSNIRIFPESLRKLVTLVESEVETYKLPGTA